MLTKNIKFKSFKIANKNIKIKNILKSYWFKNIKLFDSLKTNYKYSYSKKDLKKYRKDSIFRILGMGGSILGSEAIYQFLQHKINKKFFFLNNLKPNITEYKTNRQITNLVISKSGNTLETISNLSFILKKNQKNKNIFITEEGNNYLNLIAKKFKAEVFEHKNYIGGRYAVLSEVGMLPAELMGLNEKKFKKFNSLINNKNFVNKLIHNVSSTLKFVRQGKLNSIILNYDEKSENLFKWYQQLIAESLGKKSKGILPIISTMPRDNHSLMQLYLDGSKNNFFTFFIAREKNSGKIKGHNILSSYKYLSNKSFFTIINSQKTATERVFINKKIPFRSFEIQKRTEETLGELFCFFMLETILLGKALNVNPFDQPSVELIKKETKKILI